MSWAGYLVIFCSDLARSNYLRCQVGDQSGQSHHLVLSVIPQNLDVWAWEKYYKHQSAPAPADTKTVSLQKIDVEVVPTQSLPSDGEGKPESDVCLATS